MVLAQDFGTRGDGSTDDTIALEHAIANNDGVVELQSGKYLISKTIEIRLEKIGPIQLRGNGGRVTIINKGSGPAFRFLGTHQKTAAPADFSPSVWLHERNPVCQNFEIVGASPEADGLEFVGVMQPTVLQMSLRQLRHAVRLHQRCRNFLLHACHIYENRGIGVFLDEVNLHQAIIGDSHISYCRLGGIRIENSEIRNLQITGNDIEYNNVNGLKHLNLTDEPTADIFIRCGEKGSIREGTIASNTIQATASAQGANIRFIGNPQVGHKIGMFAISGNLIGSQTTNIHLSDVQGVTISGNHIYSGHHRNIWLERSRSIVIGNNVLGHNPDYEPNQLATGVRLERCQNSILNGNIIEDAAAGKHTVPAALPQEREALVELVACQRINVTGNQILDGTPNGLLCDEVSDVLVEGNSIGDSRSEPLMKNAILWRGPGNNNAVKSCHLVGDVPRKFTFPKECEVEVAD